jgi:UDP-glucose 4-epimerase
MRVFLTGVTGQVGRAIAAHLAYQGYQVVGMSRSTHAISGLLQHVQATLGSEGCIDRILEVVQPCEAIVHAAASLSKSPHDSAIALTNCWGTQQLLRLVDEWHTRQLIYISSVPLIGLPRFLPITEEHPAQPTSAYHASKLYGEHLVRLAERNGCAATSLRLTSPSGPGTPPSRILALFVGRALAGRPLMVLGRGTRRQNYVDVRDVACAVEACLARRTGGLYNIAASQSVSNSELALACIEELSSSSAVEFTGTPDPEEGIVWDVSIAKAQRDLGYTPQFTLRDTIRAVAHECSDSQ